MVKLFLYAVLSVSVLYGFATYHPDMFFSGSHVYNNITLHGGGQLKENVDELLDRVEAKISADEFVGPGQKFDVYLASGYGKYAFFAPFCRKEYACVHPLTGRVFLASADFEKNTAYSSQDTTRGRPLDAVLTRELVKAQIKKTMGDLAYLSVSDWKKEGYAEHIAGETRDEAPSAICEENPARKEYLSLLEYRLMVETVKSENDVSYPALMKSNYGYDSVSKKVRQRHCS